MGVIALIVGRVMRALSEVDQRYLLNGLAVVILLTVALLISAVPYKLAFLNFFYLPVLLSAYLLGRRSALLGSLLSVLAVTLYVVLFPQVFFIQQTRLSVTISIVTWAAFLFLTSYVVGSLYEYAKMELQVQRQRALNAALERAGQALCLAQEAAEAATGTKSAFLASMSHEIRTPPVPTAPVLDGATLDRLRATMGSDFLAKMIEVFLSDTPKLIGDLHQSLAGGNVEVFHRAAHSLRSTSAAFGAMTLAALCKALEEQAQAGTLDGAAERVGRVEPEYEQVRVALEAVRASGD